MNSSPATSPDKAPQQTRRVALIMLLAGALLLIGWIGVKAWRIARLAQSLQSYQAEAEALGEGGLMSVEPERAEALVMELRRDIVQLDQELRPFVPIAARLGWLPRVGPLLAHSEALLDMADAGTEAAAYAVRGLKPALHLLQEDTQAEGSIVARILPIVQEGEGDLLAASSALDRAIVARASIDTLEDFPWRVRSILEMIDAKLYLADELRLLTVFPEIMGADGRKTYLILAQNEDELRPTGGFLTGAGLLTVENGEIVDLDFEDGNTVDDWQNKPYDFPPLPLYELMGLELFLFRDANFWADFPTSAEQAMALYRYGSDNAPELDGAIAIDQQFVAMLVAVTGPVDVPQLETTVTRGNVIPTLREAWGAGEDEEHRDWLRERKDFLGPLAQALRTRLLDDFSSLDPLYLAETMHHAAQQKHLQIYARDPEVAAVLEQIGWDGRQEIPASGDYLMIVDTNVGYNKVNPLVQSSIAYDVELFEDGTGVARVSVTYQHMGEQDGASCDQVIPYSEGITYDDLMNQCFWNYLRLYIPEGATALEMDNHPIARQMTPVTAYWGQQPGARMIAEPHAANVIANAFVLPRGETLTTQYAYQLPVVVQEDGDAVYRLQLHKQAGAPPQPLTIRITIPPNTSVVETTPAASVADRQVTFETELSANTTFEVAFR